MLSKEFQAVYNIFKMNFYASMCANSKELTMQEAFSLDIIYMLDNPTILDNATYKINQMIDKGYLTKTVCKEDKRAFRLKVTKKFLSCYRDNDRYIKKTLGDIENMFSREEVELLEKMLRTVQENMTQGE